MAQYKLVSQCAGGEHLVVAFIADGGKQTLIPMTLSELLAKDPTTARQDVREILVSKDAVDILAKLQAGVPTKPNSPVPTPIDGETKS